MTEKKIDEGSPSLKPHGDVLRVPEGDTRNAKHKQGNAASAKERPAPEKRDESRG